MPRDFDLAGAGLVDRRVVDHERAARRARFAGEHGRYTNRRGECQRAHRFHPSGTLAELQPSGCVKATCKSFAIARGSAIEILQSQFAQHVERLPLAQRLCGKPHRGIHRAEPVIVAALDDLEEEAAIKGVGVGVEKVARIALRS